jgi:cytochrome c2
MVLLAGCQSNESAAPRIVGASAQRGQAAIQRFDCNVCHVIPGVGGFAGRVGPSLEGYARRAYVAGKFPNDPDHLVDWIRDPSALAPRTAMPELGVSDREARDMAAYLHTLQ